MPYGNQTSVLCKNSNEDASRNVIALNWRVGPCIVPGSQDEVWDSRAECIATSSGFREWSQPFDVTFYSKYDRR